MSPRQRLHARDIRAPIDYPDQLTDRQVRQYPDRPGLQGRDLQDHLGATASRIRLNAGALDWRQPPAPGTGQGSGGQAATQVVGEFPEGDRDGTNLVFATTYAFVPQTLRLYLNGQRAAFGAQADFVVLELQGAGTGFNALQVVWAPLSSDQIQVDYQRADS